MRYEIRDSRAVRCSDEIISYISYHISRISHLKATAICLLLTATCLLTSCEDPKDIGLNLVNSSGQIATSFTDTVSIAPSTMLLDSAITSGRAEVVVGNYKDPVFGTVEAKAFFQVNLATNQTYSGFYANYNLKSGITDQSIDVAYDSVGVYMSFNRFNYGKDTLQNITLTLYPVLEKMDLATHYTSSSSVLYDATQPLASKTFNIRDLKNANGDTTRTFKFVLNNNFGKQLFGLSGKIGTEQTVADANGVISTVTLGDNDKFHSFLQGFAIVAKQGPNVIYSFNLSDANSYLYLGYHQTRNGFPLDASNAEVVDTTKTVARYVQQFVFNGGRYSQIKVNRQGTALAKITQPLVAIPASQTGGKTFLQNGAGITTKIKISQTSLQNLLKLGKININKAELVFKTPTDSINNFPPPRLLNLAELNGNNTIIKDLNGFYTYIPIEGSSSLIYYYYDFINKQYKFNITTYLQDILSKKRNSEGLILVPVNANNTGGFSTSNTNVSRAIFDTGSIKLNIYYSIIK